MSTSKHAILTPLCGFICGIQLLSAAPDTVDTTFAASAGQFFDASDYGGIASVLVQPDGKIVFGSNEMSANGGTLRVPLVRINPDGTTDNTFFADNEPNGAGAGIYYAGQGWSEVHALGIQSDGKIIAAGVLQGMNDGTNNFSSNSIVRINPDGTVDPTLKTAGTLPWPVGGFNFIEDVTITPDDKIYCVGGFGGIYSALYASSTVRHGIARLNADGSLDTGFNINPAEFGVPGGAANIRGFFGQAAPDASGDVYVVGYFEWGAPYPADGTVKVFARLNSDGSRDFGFNPAVPANVEGITGVVVEPSGSVTVLGSIGDPATDGYMGRFTPSGAVDGSFNFAGGLGIIDARPLQRDPNGKYLLARSSGAGNFRDNLVRLNADGSLDPSFNASSAYVSDTNKKSSFNTFTTGSDGKVYSGSFFDQVQGVSTVKVVAFEGDAVPAAPGTIQFAAHAFSVSEEGGSITIPVTRTGGSTGAASALFSMTDISTTAGSDYTTVSTSVNFPAGVGGTQYVTIPITIDGTPEATEVLTLNLTGITGAAAGTTTTANLVIVDSNSPPLIFLPPTAIYVPPFDAFQLLVGVQSGASPVTYQWKKDGDDIPGATAPLYLVTSADPATHDGSYTVVVTNPNGTVTSTAVDVVVKYPAELSFSSPTFAAQEDDGSATLTLSRSGSSVGPVSVDVALTGGDATAGTDYTYATQRVSWADGEAADKTVTITLTDDSDIESPEIIVATLTNFSLDAVAGATASTTITIMDDDSPATITNPVVSVRAVDGWFATLSVGVDSQSAVTYQWFKNGVALSGETGTTITFEPVAATDFGLYTVEITNAAGTVTSGPAELGERPDPIALQPILGNNNGGIIYDPISRAAGGYYIPGSFAEWNAPAGTISAQRLVRILADGTPDPTFTPVINSTVASVAELPDGSLIIRGSFSTVDSTSAPGFAKLLPDGSLDTAFMTTIGSSYPNVSKVFIDDDGKALIIYNGGSNIARLESDGTADASFAANLAAIFTSGTFSDIQDAPNGYYLAGSYDVAGLPVGQTRRNFLRLNADGTLDNTLTPTTGNFYFDVQSDGRVVSVASGKLRRLNLDGSNDTTFTEVPMVFNNAFAVPADDSLYVSIRDVTSGEVYELRHFFPDGTRDTGFNAGNPLVTTSTLTQYSDITDITKLANGQLHLGGSFLTFNGNPVVFRPVIINGELLSIAITSQSSLTVVDPGDDVILQVVVSSAFPLNYQWRKNGADLPGATFPTLSLSGVSTADTADYDLVITSTEGFVVSEPIPLFVRDAPVILSAPTGTTQLIGTELSLTVDFAALAPATIQWFKAGVGALSGENGATLTIDPATAGDSGRYYAIITNALGAATSTEAIVQIIPDPAGLVAGFIPATGGSNNINHIAPDNNGGALLTGSYFSLTHPSNNGQAYLNRVDATGAPDPAFSGSSNQNIGSTAYDGNGGFILAGSNFLLNGSSGNYLERIDANGQTDASFAANRGFFNSASIDVIVDGAGNIYVGGNGYVKRFAPDGTPDTTFNPSFTGSIDAMALDGGSKLYLKSQSALMVFNPDGTPDPGFTLDPAVNMSGTLGLGIAEDGSIAIGAGNLQSVYVLNPNGSLRSTLPVPGMTYNSLLTLDVQANGKILVAYNQGKRLIRLLPDGTEDPMFDVGTGITGTIRDIDIHTDGTIWVGGAITAYNGTTAYGYVRLNGDPLDLNINVQPTDQVVDIGQTATFSVTATTLGAEPMSFQWRKNGVALSNGGDVSGADTNTLMIANTDLTDEADYDVVVTNDTTGTEKTTLTATLTVLEAPEILVELDPGFDLEVGDSINLSLSVRGAGTLDYQWQKDGDDIPGETGATLTIDPLAVTDSGAYRVVITNTYGSITSAATTVTVVLSPAAIAPTYANMAFQNTVRAILPLPDGRTLVGGQFTSINNGSYQAIDELALLNVDGTLDTSFDLTPNGVVLSLTLAPDGGVLVGGSFTYIGGATRQCIARLNPDLTLDTAFDTSSGANSEVNDIAVDANGRIYLGGNFTAFGGDTSAAYLCRLKADGSLDTSFTTSGLNVVYQVVPTSDGKVVAGGAFNLTGNRHIARFNSDGSHDTSFTATAGNLRYPYALLQMPDGGWLAGTNYGVLYRYDANGVQDLSMSFSANGSIWTLALEDDGQIIVGGQFTTFDGINLNRLARLNSDGSIDPTFTIGDGTNNTVYAAALQPLGKIWVGGQFSTYRGTTADRLTLLNGDPLKLAIVQDPANAVVEPSQTAMFTVTTAATDTVSYQWQRNGVDLTDVGDISGATTDTLSIANVEEADADTYRVVVTHDVTMETKTSAAATLTVLGAPEILTQPIAVTTEAGLGATFSVTSQGVSPLMFQWYRNGIALTDGAAVSGATTSELTLSALTVAHSGNITVRVSNGLGFADSSVAVLNVEKLPAGIARDLNLPLSVSSTVNDALPFDDGSYLIGGAFTSVTHTGGSASRRYLAKFNTDGTADLTFPQVSGNGNVFAIEQAPDGKIYIGGGFGSLDFNGSVVSSKRIVRVNADGTYDAAFDPGTGPVGNVQVIRPLANGKVYIAGTFTSVGGQTGTAYMARLNADGSVDTSFVSQASTTVEDLGLNADGTVWVAHSNNWGGQSRIVRVDATGAVVAGYNNTSSMTSTEAIPTADGGVLSFGWSWPYQQKISPLGTKDGTWPVGGGVNNRIYGAADIGGGRTIISGTFSFYAGIARSGLAVIEEDGSLNPDFDPQTGFNGGYPPKIRVDSLGRIWCMGNLTTYKGETIPRFVVLNGFATSNDDPFTAYLDAVGVPEGDQAPDNDYDLDGWPNLIEFLYDSNPADPCGGLGAQWNPANSSPTGASINATDPGASLDPAKNYRTVHVRVPVDKKGLTIGLEAGLDLTDFGSGSVQVHPLGAPTADGPDHEIQVYYLTPATDHEPRMFWRLKVEQ